MLPNAVSTSRPPDVSAAPPPPHQGQPSAGPHAAAAPQQSVDFSAELLARYGDFQQAQQMNHSLIALYKLLAHGRISPRQASVLAYIGSLVLRSLKDVDYDLDRFDDEPGEVPDEKPPAKPVAAQPVGPGKEPLPATAEEFAAQVLNRKPN